MHRRDHKLSIDTKTKLVRGLFSKNLRRGLQQPPWLHLLQNVVWFNRQELTVSSYYISYIMKHKAMMQFCFLNRLIINGISYNASDYYNFGTKR